MNKTTFLTPKMRLPTNLDYCFYLHILAVHLRVGFDCHVNLYYKSQNLQGTIMGSQPVQVKPKSTLMNRQQNKFIVNSELYLEGNSPEYIH